MLFYLQYNRNVCIFLVKYMFLRNNNKAHKHTPNSVVLFPQKNDSNTIKILIIILSKNKYPITKRGANAAECQHNPDGYHTQLRINDAFSTKCNVSTNIILLISIPALL